MHNDLIYQGCDFCNGTKYIYIRFRLEHKI